MKIVVCKVGKTDHGKSVRKAPAMKCLLGQGGALLILSTYCIGNGFQSARYGDDAAQKRDHLSTCCSDARILYGLAALALVGKG